MTLERDFNQAFTDRKVFVSYENVFIIQNMALPQFILTELQSLRVVNNFALNGILAQTLEPERKYQNSRLCIF